jgi:hypothetical protein
MLCATEVGSAVRQQPYTNEFAVISSFFISFFIFVFTSICQNVNQYQMRKNFSVKTGKY